MNATNKVKLNIKAPAANQKTEIQRKLGKFFRLWKVCEEFEKAPDAIWTTSLPTGLVSAATMIEDAQLKGLPTMYTLSITYAGDVLPEMPIAYYPPHTLRAVAKWAKRQVYLLSATQKKEGLIHVA